MKCILALSISQVFGLQITFELIGRIVLTCFVDRRLNQYENSSPTPSDALRAAVNRQKSWQSRVLPNPPTPTNKTKTTLGKRNNPHPVNTENSPNDSLRMATPAETRWTIEATDSSTNRDTYIDMTSVQRSRAHTYANPIYGTPET